jgi:probable phosphoglycerate mutase
MQQRWPERIWLVRHGESAGNVARASAHAAGLDEIELAHRDADIPLSGLGERQARALGQWFAATPDGERPNVVLVSPYVRAQQTADLIRDGGGLSSATADFLLDERLREKEFGILDRLTPSGIARDHPQQARFRAEIGKFYHRPPGGESWCDVILRLRSLLNTISVHHDGCRVLIVSHQVVVLCMRYLLENMSEAQVLGIAETSNVANCGLTEYRFDPNAGRLGRMALALYNFVVPLEETGTPVTAAPDANVAPR